MTAFVVQNATRQHNARKEMQRKRIQRVVDFNRIAETDTNNDARFVRRRSAIYEDEDDDDEIEIVVVN